jgi:hypothetical protein
LEDIDETFISEEESPTKGKENDWLLPLQATIIDELCVEMVISRLLYEYAHYILST